MSCEKRKINTESPGQVFLRERQAFLRERQEKTLLRNTAALGGLGDDNIITGEKNALRNKKKN